MSLARASILVLILVGFLSLSSLSVAIAEPLGGGPGGLSNAQIEQIAINTAGRPTAGVEPAYPLLFGGQLFFAGDSDVGRELWVSDGTPGGTQVFADLNPGSEESAPENLVAVGAYFYFSAWDEAHGRELWRSDGTVAGTVRVTDGNPGAGYFGPYTKPVVLGDELFYLAVGDDVERLWKTDVTTLVTTEIRSDLEVTSNQPVVANGLVFFGARSGTGPIEIWVSDGTFAGTYPVTNAQCTNLYELVAAGTEVFFSCNDKLWITDGSLIGIFQLAAFSNSSPSWLTVAQAPPADPGIRLFFNARGSTSQGYELWTSDGTSGGTVQVADLNPGNGNSSPSGLRADGGSVVFAADDGSDGIEPYWADENGVHLIRDIHPTGSSFPSSFTRQGGFLYFRACDDTHGCELWRTDRTMAGTTLVKDIVTGPTSSKVKPLLGTPLGLALVAETPITGPELWGSDGTAAGTVRFTDFVSYDSYPHDPVVVGEFLRFGATDSAGDEPWQVTAGASSATRLADIAPGAAHSNPFSDGAASLPDGRTLFDARNGSGPSELWSTDGTGFGTVSLGVLDPVSGSSAYGFTAALGKVFFEATDGTHSYELWSSDGSGAGTQMLGDLNPGGAGSYPEDMVETGGYLYFLATDGTAGKQLWRSDGTEMGTVPILILNASGPGGSEAEELVTAGDKLFYSATDGAAHGHELVVFDGTVATILDLYPGPDSSYPMFLIPWDEKVVFTALEPSGEWELWVSDGTVAGTHPLDVNPGAPFLLPAALGASAGGLVFAQGIPGTGPFELRVTDGTPGMSTMLATVDWVDTLYSSFADLDVQSLGGYLYFSAEQVGVTGIEPWRTNGSAAGTESIDFYPGPTSSFPVEYRVVGSRVYFSAQHPDDGWQLFALEPVEIFTDGFEGGSTSAWTTVVIDSVVQGQER